MVVEKLYDFESIKLLIIPLWAQDYSLHPLSHREEAITIELIYKGWPFRTRSDWPFEITKTGNVTRGLVLKKESSL